MWENGGTSSVHVVLFRLYKNYTKCFCGMVHMVLKSHILPEGLSAEFSYVLVMVYVLWQALLKSIS